MVKMSDFLMPFLKDRAVTVIRYPHGAPGESFFKKQTGLHAGLCLKRV